MATRIQLRRDSAADWTALDPVLAAGEVGVETDTGLEKLGDGATAWSALDYRPVVAATEAEALAGTNDTKAMTPAKVEDVVGLGQTAAELAAGLGITARSIPPHTVSGWLNIERFGCVGDDSTDNATTLRKIFLFAAASGYGIFIPPGVFCTSLPLDFLANTTVWCVGTVKINQDHSAGAFLLIKQTDDNIKWFGGTVDGGGTEGVVNMNGIAAGYDPTTLTISKNVQFTNVRVVNCREDPSLDPDVFAAGGKGLTLQFHVDGAQFSNIVIEDCDVPFSIESAVSDNRTTENMQLTNILARNCKRGPFLGGTRPGGSLDDFGYDESTYSQVVGRNIILDNCGTHSAVSTNYGAINANYASCMDMEFTIRNDNDATDKVTLWRGNIAHSRIRINAFVDNMQDAVDMRPIPGTSGELLTSAGYEFDVTAHVADSISGVLWRGAASLVLRGEVSVTYYHDTVPTLVADVDSSLSNRYRFWDMRTGKKCQGNTAQALVPAMADFTTVAFYEANVDFQGSLYVNDKLIAAGTSSPEGAVSAPPGSIYLRSGGGVPAALYRKVSGSGTTGWRGENLSSSGTSSSSLTVDSNQFSSQYVTALAANMTINAPTGSPSGGQTLEFWIYDNGTIRTLTWNAVFIPIGVTLPAATVVGKWTYVRAVYNAAHTEWHVVDVKVEA